MVNNFRYSLTGLSLPASFHSQYCAERESAKLIEVPAKAGILIAGSRQKER